MILAVALAARPRVRSPVDLPGRGAHGRIEARGSGRGCGGGEEATAGDRGNGVMWVVLCIVEDTWRSVDRVKSVDAFRLKFLTICADDGIRRWIGESANE